MTTDPMIDKWTTRDLPFLRVAARHLEASNGAQAAEFAAEAGLTADDANIAARALVQAGYLEGNISRSMGPMIPRVILSDLTERGRRAVGIWPADDDVSALIAALEDVANRTTDPEQRSRIKQVIAGFGGFTREVLVEITAATATRFAGMS